MVTTFSEHVIHGHHQPRHAYCIDRSYSRKLLLEYHQRDHVTTYTAKINFYTRVMTKFSTHVTAVDVIPAIPTSTQQENYFSTRVLRAQRWI